MFEFAKLPLDQRLPYFQEVANRRGLTRLVLLWRKIFGSASRFAFFFRRLHSKTNSFSKAEHLYLRFTALSADAGNVHRTTAAV
jgi:hypothetical protein